MIKKSIYFKLCLLFALGLLLTGCAHMPVGIAASDTPLNGRKYDILGPTRGHDSGISFLGIIPLPGGRNYIKDAIQDAKNRKGADALIDITVEYDEINFVLLSIRKTTVYGTAIRFKNGTRTKQSKEVK